MSRSTLRMMIAGAAAIVLSVTAGVIEAPVQAASTQIKAVVNNVAITSGDVAKRVNFLKLRRVKGNLSQVARDELVNEVLMRQEILRTGQSVSTDDVDAAFARFANGNKMSPEQLTKLLGQAGVTADHFKAYIGVSMSWPRVVTARYGGSEKVSTEDMVQRLKANNGKKPTSTEFILQQMIFVVPDSKRGKIIGKRKAEADASRKSYPGCENAKVFAATMLDVSVRNLGRFMLQELPPEWKDELAKTEQGQTTKARVTEKGVEYIAVCKRRDVSDDLAATMVYQAEDLQKAEKDNQDPKSKKYLDFLRKKAQIVLH